MKFWEDEDDIEGPTELYSIKTTVDLNRDWSFSAGNDLIYGRLIPEFTRIIYFPLILLETSYL